MDGVAAAPGEGVDDEVAGRGAGGLRRCDGLRGGGVPALGVHAHAAVIEVEEAVPVHPVLARHGRLGSGNGGDGGGGGIGAPCLDVLLLLFIRRPEALGLPRSRDLAGRLGRAAAGFGCSGAEKAEEAVMDPVEEPDGVGAAPAPGLLRGGASFRHALLVCWRYRGNNRPSNRCVRNEF